MVMKLDLGKITGTILESYRQAGGFNNADQTNLPSKRALATICEDLLQLVFPGFHDLEPIHSQHLTRVTSHRVFSIADRLLEEGDRIELLRPLIAQPKEDRRDRVDDQRAAAPRSRWRPDARGPLRRGPSV